MPNDKEFELDDLESFSFDDLSLDEAPAAPGVVPDEDPLGVWVKSAPEDIEAESVPVAPDADLSEEDFLSTEELANLDDSFEIVTVDEPLVGEDPLDAEAPPAFDEISLDDFISSEEPADEEIVEDHSPLPALDEPEPEEEPPEEFLDIDIDIDDEINDEILEVNKKSGPLSEASLEPDSFAAEEIDLSEFGDFEEVTPVTAGPLGDGEDLPEVKELPEIVDLDEGLVLTEDDGFFEEEVLEEPSDSIEDAGSVSLALEPDDETDLDHILALEEDLTSGIRGPEPISVTPPVPVADPSPAQDVAAQILGKIEQELSSIKQEITELKKEVTQLRDRPLEPGVQESPVAAAVTENPVTEPGESVEDETPKSRGFFDEEDDETIALTGDELDNILSTAEISEGEETGETPDEDLLNLDVEGNLIDPAPAETEVHVTDEEFFAGTALAEEPEPTLGVPESIELEEGLPLDLDDGETEDLLSESLDFEAEPVVESFDEPGLPAEPEALELPSDELPPEEEVALELADSGSLAPDLAEVDEPTVDIAAEESFEPSLETLDLDPAEGWTPPLEEPLPTPPPAPQIPAQAAPSAGSGMSPGLKDELRAVLSYMDKLLASLPDDKIQEFAESEHFEVYKRLFEELGLVE